MKTFRAEIVNNDQPHTLFFERKSAEEVVSAIWETYGMGIYIADIVEVEDNGDNR